MENTKDLLHFAVELGDAMLRNGAEVYRVEDSILAILDSYNVKDYDVYVLTNGIFASADEATAEASSIIRHVPMHPMHFGRIANLNSLCRQVCNKDISIEAAWDKLEEYKTIPTYSLPSLIVATGIGCGSLSYLFGGSILDGFLAVFVGMILRGFLYLCEKNNYSKPINNVLGSAVVTILALLLFTTGLNIHYDKIIIGAIMPLVPGIALTNSIRDFINSDYLSGTIRLIDALLTSFCIAVGVGLVITFAQMITGGMF